MGTASCTQAGSRVTSECGRWYVSVPWEQADNLRSRLKRRGCPSTVCLDPLARQARLELWPGVSPDQVAAELELA
jgi:hypothetical protein